LICSARGTDKPKSSKAAKSLRTNTTLGGTITQKARRSGRNNILTLYKPKKVERTKMNKLQYDSFYKFIVSIATLLITAPVLGIYYLFTGSYDILLSEQEYLDLSKISLESIQSREKLMNIICHMCFLV
jgi:hypothetical protein